MVGSALAADKLRGRQCTPAMPVLPYFGFSSELVA
jgi:hypothetical protein